MGPSSSQLRAEASLIEAQGVFWAQPPGACGIFMGQQRSGVGGSLGSCRVSGWTAPAESGLGSCSGFVPPPHRLLAGISWFASRFSFSGSKEVPSEEGEGMGV